MATLHFRALPSLLFTPGTKSDAFTKGFEIGASGVILDLEDGIGPNEAHKARARRQIIDFLNNKKPQSHRPFAWIVRVNHITTSQGREDIAALTQQRAACDAIAHPKTESSEEVEKLAAAFAETHPKIPILAFIESSKGFFHAQEVIAKHPQIQALLFGAADYAADVGAKVCWESLLYARSQLVQLAAIRKLALYDSPYFHMHDEQGLKKEIQQIKQLGFTGKQAIHPEQIRSIMQGFTPDSQEIERAKQIVQAFKNAGGNACELDGLMIDQPIYLGAEQVLELARQTKLQQTR